MNIRRTIPLLLSLAVVFLLTLLGACTSIPVEERAEVRAEIERDAAKTLVRMMEEDPEFKKQLTSATGCFVSSVSAKKVPVVGRGHGLGVLYDRETGSSTYMNITRADLGAGLGAGQFGVVVLFENRETLEEFRGGIRKMGLGSETVVKSRSKSFQSASGKGYSTHFISDSGVALTASARVTRLSVNEDLTGNAVSEVGLPNIGFDRSDDPGDSAPRIWEHKLPFFAQAIIDEGYDLPLPYGIGVTYANVKQSMFLEDLAIGFNGDEIVPFEFIAFDNAEAHNETVQVMLDAWVLPFMNVFAMFGTLEGDAPLDVLVDGNTMLDHLGIDCSVPPPSPLCPILKDKDYTLSLTAPFSGQTYGLGTTLAGGWGNWFVAIPGTITYADMDGTSTDGLAITVTPRVGRVVNMGRGGNLALFVGGNYLYADFTVVGTIVVPELNDLTIDYTLEQKNKDPWNGVLGLNWDINKNISWMIEYNGFVGSRTAFITGATWRF